MAKLNQIIAIEKGAKNKAKLALDKIDKTFQKAVLFDGLSKKYQPKQEGGEVLPPQNQKVQQRAEDLIEEAAQNLAEVFDITASKDWTNTGARADVVLDGETLLEQVPTTFLLYLEKQLVDWKTLLEHAPVLDPAEVWRRDEGTKLFTTDPQEAQRTKKEQRALVLYPATEKHPAQTQLVVEDIVAGTWVQTRFSGAMEEARRKALINKADKLIRAVKAAREEANLTPAVKQEIGAKIFGALGV